MSVLGLFARYPQPGRTKTRLAADLGDDAAASLYACFVRDLACRTGELADEQWLAVTPNDPICQDWFQQLDVPPHTQRRILPQPDGDLGDRMSWFFRQAAVEARGPAVLLGTDSPDLPSSLIGQALDILSRAEADMVLSPAADGGYVLVGINGDPGDVFMNIRWSSPHTLLDTLQAAEAVGWRVQLLPAWYDVDYVENLGTLLALQTASGGHGAAECPRTADYLRQLPLFSRHTD